MPIPRNLSIPGGGGDQIHDLKMLPQQWCKPRPTARTPRIIRGAKKGLGDADWIGVRRYDAGPPPPGGRSGAEPCWIHSLESIWTPYRAVWK